MVSPKELSKWALQVRSSNEVSKLQPGWVGWGPIRTLLGVCWEFDFPIEYHKFPKQLSKWALQKSSPNELSKWALQIETCLESALLELCWKFGGCSLGVWREFAGISPGVRWESTGIHLEFAGSLLGIHLESAGIPVGVCWEFIKWSLQKSSPNKVTKLQTGWVCWEPSRSLLGVRWDSDFPIEYYQLPKQFFKWTLKIGFPKKISKWALQMSSPDWDLFGVCWESGGSLVKVWW